MPLVIAGATSGSTTVQATDAVTATITLPSATDTLVGKTTPSFTTTIGVGNATPSTSGAGITFPATQSASSNANTLDDYEEGTWTPTLTFNDAAVGMTYASRTGYYTKVGNAVTVSMICSLTNKGSSTGGMKISGLPFTINGTMPSVAAVQYDYLNVSSNVAYYLSPSQSYFGAYVHTSGAVAQILNDTHFASNTMLRATVTYFV